MPHPLQFFSDGAEIEPKNKPTTFRRAARAKGARTLVPFSARTQWALDHSNLYREAEAKRTEVPSYDHHFESHLSPRHVLTSRNVTL